MSSATGPVPFPGARARRAPRALLRAVRLPRPELAALLVLAALLDLWSLSRNGWANDYYSAAARSMSTSWHDFLYASFDRSGLMTVDKPPLALWVQALSVRAFGFHPLSLLVPQALMGVASVALVYDLVRRRFGRAAGLAAGLALATTPVAVAVSRHNNPDALLVLCSVAALWFAARALEDGRTRRLVLAGVCAGLGFETKMGAGLLVLPGIAAAWLWVAPRGRVAALRSGVVAAGTFVAVAGAWPLLVALTPARDRPWISGTSDNSIWSLITGYNGLGRLDGQAGGPGGGGPGGPGGGGPGGVFGGRTGPLRLLHESLGGQAGWLLGLALASLVTLAVATRLRRRDAATGWVIAVGGAFLTTAAAFSFASGIFHPYYVSLLAPSTAALAGAGVVRLARTDRLARIAGPLAVAAAVAAELVVLGDDATNVGWLAVPLCAAGAAGAYALAVVRDAHTRSVVLGALVALLLAGPAIWSVQTLGHATSGTFPAGGPATAGFGGRPGGPGALPGGLPGGGRLLPMAQGGRPGGLGPPPGGGFGAGPGGPGGQDLSSVLRYVRAHGGGTVAVSSQQGAATSIIRSGADVAGIGGFSGRESEVSVSWLADAVRAGRIRWVVADGGGFMGGAVRDGRVGASRVLAAVRQSCTRASTSSTSLYDCAGRADALAG